MNLGNDYFYGAYVKFVLNGSGGGSGSGTPQTGDWLGIVLISLLVTALIAATVIAFVKRNSLVDIAKSISAKSGTVASAISNHRVIVAAIIAIGILLIAGITFSSKAFAESNEYKDPAAPPYQTAVASIDGNTQKVSIPTITINDNYQPHGATVPGDFRAAIKSFSIKPLNGLKSNNLGTWTVYLDGKEVYNGQALNSFDWEYICEEKGQCTIDIEVSNLDPSMYEVLNDQLCAVVEFKVASALFDEDIDDSYKATVYLDNGQQHKNLTPQDMTSFLSYICDEKEWETTDNSTFTKDFPIYTSFGDVLSDWKSACDSGMFTVESSTDFYAWEPTVNASYSYLFINEDEYFTPYWYPALKDIDFEYKVNKNIQLTSYGQQVFAEHGWQYEQQEIEPGETEPAWVIKGKFTNRANIDELNAILNSECFSLDNFTFEGWEKYNEMIFNKLDNDDKLINELLLNPILSPVDGTVIDENSNPVPNISVTFEPKGWKTNKVKMSNGHDGIYSTTTDSNGNYILSCPKGITGFFRFGGYYHSTSQNELVGASIMVDKVDRQTLAPVVLKQKATINVTTNFPPLPSNSAKLDDGMVKFITTDDSGSQKVFYGEGWDGKANLIKIEVYANVSGKIVYDSALCYGELNVDDTGTSTSSHTLNINMKTPEMADCTLYGQVVLVDSAGNVTPFVNSDVVLYLKDSSTGQKSTYTIHTDATGHYTCQLFQNVYIEEVKYFDPASPSKPKYAMHYSATMLFGDSYELNITLYDAEEEVDEIIEAA